MPKNRITAAYWADRLQSDVEIVAQVLGGEEIRFCGKSKAVKANRVLAYRHDQNALILLPKTIDARAEATIKEKLATGTKEVPLWRDFIGYRDTPIEDVAQSENIRRLRDADGERLMQLKVRCTKKEVEMGEVGIADPVVVGYFDDDVLVGVASFLYAADEQIADVGVLIVSAAGTTPTKLVLRYATYARDNPT